MNELKQFSKNRLLLQIPEKLIESLKSVAGFDEQSFRDIHSHGDSITSIRTNPAKNIDSQNQFQGAENVSWSSNGFYLNERPSFTLDPLFHAGTYYVQEASSMFLEEVLRQTGDLSKPLRVLDLCAAPGGKSTLIQSIISGESLLVSNEVIRTRVSALTENMMKWGGENVIVTNNDAADFQRLPGFFNVIVVDAPCSGSGLFRKDNNAISEWSEANVNLCSARQERILHDVLLALASDGVLIYSTCSYSEAENELVADALIDTAQLENLRLNVDRFPGICESVSPQHGCFGYRFYPDKIKGEGFFIAAFRKVSHAEEPRRSKAPKLEFASANEKEIVSKYLTQADRFSFLKTVAGVIALPSIFSESFALLKENLYIKKTGIFAGEIAHGELLPAHELAMSTILKEDAFSALDVSLETARDYLRKKDIAPGNAEKGWALVRYEAHGLGFAKVLASRVNNYYPKALRILNR